MNGDELKLLADHMGHSLEIHANIYRLQSSLLERTKVARILTAVDCNKLWSFKGQQLDTVPVEGK